MAKTRKPDSGDPLDLNTPHKINKRIVSQTQT